MTTFQAALLLLFNDDAKLTLEQVTERLHLPAEDTVRALHSLSCAKYKILIKVRALTRTPPLRRENIEGGGRCRHQPWRGGE